MIVDDFQDEIITDVTAAADNPTASSASISIDNNDSVHADEEEEYCNTISPNNNNSRSQQQQRRLRTLDSFLEQAFQVTKNNKNIHNSTTTRSNSFYSSLEEQQDQQDQQPTRSSSSSYDAIDTNTNPHQHATKESSRSTATAATATAATTTRFDETSLAITIPVIPNNQTVGESTSSIIINAIKNQWKYWCIILSLGVANSSDASEILCLSYILSDATFRQTILNDTSDTSTNNTDGSGLVTGAVFFGMLLGGLIVGTMGDWIGRKPMLVLGLVCNTTAGMLSVLAQNVSMLALLRMIAGIGIGATVPPIFTLATELAPTSVRGFCVTIVASFWMVGSIFVAIMALYFFELRTNDYTAAAGQEEYEDTASIATWRLFALVCALPSAIGAILVHCFVPESPRFLGMEGRSQEAVDVANTLARKMGYFTLTMTTTTTNTINTIKNNTIDNHNDATTDNDNNDTMSSLLLTIKEVELSFPQLTTPTRKSSSIHNSDYDNTTIDDTFLLGRSRFSSTATMGGGTATATGISGIGNKMKDCYQFLQLAYTDFIDSTSKLYYGPKHIVQTTLALQMVWFALSFGSYGLLTWINIIFVKVKLENVYYNALLFAFSNLPGNILSGLFMDSKYVGRSYLLIGSIVLSSISLVSFAIFATNVEDDDSSTTTYTTATTSTTVFTTSTGIILSACCFQCFTIMAWNTIDTMTSELFPTILRSTGLGICGEFHLVYCARACVNLQELYLCVRLDYTYVVYVCVLYQCTKFLHYAI